MKINYLEIKEDKKEIKANTLERKVIVGVIAFISQKNKK